MALTHCPSCNIWLNPGEGCLHVRAVNPSPSGRTDGHLARGVGAAPHSSGPARTFVDDGDPGLWRDALAFAQFHVSDYPADDLPEADGTQKALGFLLPHSAPAGCVSGPVPRASAGSPLPVDPSSHVTGDARV